MNEDRWNKTKDKLPKENMPVAYIDSSGKEHRGCYYNNLWWTEEDSMYIYFTPELWKYRKE